MKRTAPTVSGPLSGGRGWTFGAPAQDLAARGYVLEEFLLEGAAVGYRAKPGTTSGRDGVWDTEPTAAQPYVTRLYVVRPADPARFNGVVLVNWQNVTAGVDLGAPDGEEVFRGYAWAGVTTQKIGVDGATTPAGRTVGLTAWDPARYGRLTHPGDAVSYDIFTQAGRLLRDGPPPGQPDPLGGLRPRLLVATGSSQSAMRLASYINAAHSHAQVFDAFYLTVHWGICPPLEEVPLHRQMKPLPGGLYAGTARIHDRGDVPVLVLATECEALHNYPVRQPDTDSFRFWEIAGAAHTDVTRMAAIQEVLARDGVGGALGAYAERNQVSWGYVSDAGLRAIVRWARDRAPPPRVPPIEIDADAAGRLVARRDAHGNALGGIRLPEIAAATGVHRGTNDQDPMTALSGHTRLFNAEELARAHGDRATFLARWDAAVAALESAALALPAEAAGLRARGREAWP